METMTSDLLLNLYAEEMGSKYKCLDVIAGFACGWCTQLRHECYMEFRSSGYLKGDKGVQAICCVWLWFRW